MPPSEFAVQPLISTDALQDLRATVPGECDPSRIESAQISDSLTTRRIAAGRIWQVLKTSMPLFGADLLGLSASFLLATLVATWATGWPVPVGLLNHILGFSVAFTAVATFLGLYPASAMNPVIEMRQQVTAIFVAALLLITVNGLVGVVAPIEVVTLCIGVPLAILVMPVSRFSTRQICGRFSWWGENAIIVGAGKQGRAVHRFFRNMPHRGLKAIGIVDDDPSRYWSESKTDDDVDFLGTIDGVMKICRDNDAHWIIAAVADRSEEEVTAILNRCSLVPNLIFLSSPLMLPSLWVRSSDCVGLSGIHIRDRLLFPFQRVVKRIADILLSGMLLVLFSPLLLVSAILIRMRSPGSVFYGDARIGRAGRRFKVWKIRTMVQGASELLADYLDCNPESKEEWERDSKLKNDPRIIPGIGHFLRTTSLDEIPQLWNVFVGDMSLVGPRPIFPHDAEKYHKVYPLYLRVRPGLTGLWQVSGRNNTTYEARVHLDTYYVRNWSLWLDYFILLRTIRTVLRREGSY